MKWLSSSYWTPAFVSYHDPGNTFNLDITGGMPAVLIYMLIQSTVDEIKLLPALPAEWPDGEIKGVLARGGFEVDMKWENSVPVNVKIKSLHGNKTNVLFNGKSKTVKLQKGKSIKLEF
jgi:alpha-L-fucosidase 2